MFKNRIFLFSILFFGFTAQVYASNLEIIPIDNYYIFYNNNSYKLNLFKDDVSDNFLYALEPYCEIESVLLNIKTVEDYTKLDVDLKNDIQDLLYLGYGYKEHNDIKWYMISQYMLWDALGYDVDIKNSFGVSVKNVFEKEFVEYERLIKNFKIIPSYFNEGSININYNEKYVLEDFNNVSDNFNLIPYSFLRISNSGGEVIIYGKQPAQSKLVAVRKEQNSKFNKIYYTDTLEFIDSVNVSKRLFEVNVNVHGGKISVLNLDGQDNPIKGTVYNIYDLNDKYIDTIITNEFGEGTSNFVPYNNYYLLEKTIDSQYGSNSQKVYINMVDFGISKLLLKNQLLNVNEENEDVIIDNNFSSNVQEDSSFISDDFKEQDIILDEEQSICSDVINDDYYEVEVPNTNCDITWSLLIVVFGFFAIGLKLYVF